MATTAVYDGDADVSIGTSILMQFTDSRREDHHQLRAVVVGVSHGIKQRNLSPTPPAYLAATCSSLLLLEESTAPMIIDAHLTVLSLVIPKVSPAKLMDEIELVTRSLVHVLRWSESLSQTSALWGIKCLSHLFITIRNHWSHNSSAAAFSALYGCLLGFVTYHNYEVREQQWSCLREVLRSLQGTMLIDPASEAITELFKKWFPCGEPIAVGSPGRTVARPAMFVLDTLTECLFLMSTKYKLAILNDFKIILELLRSPVTTRRITDCLRNLCDNNPSPDVPPPLLLDLLCSLAHSVYKNENPIEHNTKFTARLLSIGVAKIYSSNRQLCVMKLPVVFNALKAIMGQTSEKDIQGYDSEPDVEHQHSAAFSFKCLIHACIDKALIKEGVDQIVIHSNINIDASKSHQPSIIEQVCAIIESILGYQYTAIWDLAFEIVSTMFDKLGGYSSYFMKGTLNRLAGMQKLTKKEIQFRKQMHECLGSALVAMGPEKFLGLLPLNLEAEDPSEVNDWLFPILTKYTVGARLSFFTNSILVMVGIMREKSQKLRLQGHSSRKTDALVNSLWSLLPSFCNFPSDTNESFKDLEHALCNALLGEPEIGGIICSSLQVLIRQNKGTTEEADDLSTNNVSIAEQRALASYTPQVTAENLRVLRQSASHFLSVLSAVFLENRDYEGNLLQSTIEEFASISNTEVVSVLFNNTMEKLSEVTLEANKAESSIRTRLLDLAVSLLPGLNSGEVDNLFTATKLALQDNEILIQRKAYEVLSIVFKKCHTFTSWKIEEWHRLMMEVLPSCHSLAKEHRLECLHLLVVQVLKSDTEQRRPEITSSFLAEIIHALKETNKRTRDRAFDILVQIGHACGDAERGGTREHRHKFFDMVAEGLACRTPHMISATTEGLARLAFEFSDLVSTSTNLLPSTLRCLTSGSQEIIKSNLGFLKVLVVKLPSEVLQLHTKSMVENLLSSQVYCETSLKAKVKLLLEMVVNKCGLHNIRAVMPGEQMEVLAEIHKITVGQEKRILGCKSMKERSHMSKASTFRLSRWNYTEIFSDFDEETFDSKADNMDVDTVSGRYGKAATSRLKSKSLVRSKSRKHKRSDEDVEFTTFALARKKLLRQRVELQVDHASERLSASARQTAPDSYDRWLAKIATGEVISGAAQKNLGLKLKRVDIKHGM